MKNYLKKHKSKACTGNAPVFSAGVYREFPDTQVRMLSPEEAEKYLSQRSECKVSVDRQG